MISRVRITGLAYGSNGVARLDGKVVFVPFTAPGDEAEVEIVADKKSYSEARLVKLLEPSPLRCEPPCPYYYRCGGCNIQHIRYPEQVSLKQEIFEDTLKRIGKVEPSSYDEPVASPEEFGYRSRARFQVHGRSWGFFEHKSTKVVDIDGCPLLDERINETFRSLRSAFAGSAVLRRAFAGLFSVEIGVSESDGMTVAAFHVSRKPADSCTMIREALAGVVRYKGHVVRYDRRGGANGAVFCRCADSAMDYVVDGMTLSASISVFSQVNRTLNRELVKKTVEYADIKEGSSVLDLFSGVGNLTLPFAKRGASATGVESDAEAVEMARGNAKMNSVEGAVFVRSQSLRWLEANAKTLDESGLDVLILDPPRGGEPGSVKMTELVRPGKIVYVSCSPPTLARDVSLLAGSGYVPLRAGLIDMFPQTYHMEGIVELRRVDT